MAVSVKKDRLLLQNVLTVKHQKVVYWLNQQVNSLQSLH